MAGYKCYGRFTYQDAADMMRSARSPEDGKPLANNTRLYPRGENYAVRLHSTDVVTLHPDGTYTLSSGGWRTPTTKQRINDFSPARVSQWDNAWHVATGERGEHAWIWDSSVLFYDGIVVDARGVPISPPQPDTIAGEKAYHALRRDFIRGWLAHLRDLGHMPEPSGGDCWYCLMFDPNLESADHILSHMSKDERYYVPNFLRRCFDIAGFGNPGFVWELSDVDLRRGSTFHVERALKAFFRARQHILMPAYLETQKQPA